jgi:UDP-glucose 4-epimerase
LLAEGHTVLGIDSFEDYYARSQKEDNLSSFLDNDGFEFLDESILDLGRPSGDEPPRLRELVSEVDWVFHLAAQAGVRASWGSGFSVYTDLNVLATQYMLEACKDTNVERFVYASSSSVYGDTDVMPMREDARPQPFSPYGVTKLAAEHLALLYWRNYGLPAVSLRFFTVYGPRQRPDMAFHRFIADIRAGKPIHVFGDGGQTRDFTFVGDIVDGIMAATQAPSGLVANLAGGSRVSLAEALDLLHDAVDTDFEIVNEADKAGDVRDTWASIEQATAHLGYDPKVGLAEGLRAEAEWYDDFVQRVRG